MSFIPVYIVILLSTIVIDYFAGILIEQSKGRRRYLFLLMSIIANIGVLAFFKYFNFLNDNISYLFNLFDATNPVSDLKFFLPIGLSFHTFQAMSYTIEVYRGHQKAERKFGIYALYVMFYPQLVAGPIERPQNIIHQFYEPKQFEYARVVEGLKIMMWGFFKKLVVADRLAIYVNTVYNNAHHHSGSTLLVATIFFWFQIYCDFSGYSDIAIGSAKVMGYNLMENFRRPLFSKSLSEIAGRWHISLYSWFRDYLFSPLAKKSRRNRGKILFYVVLVFTLSGLWHGAAWTYIFWGAFLGIGIVIERLYQNKVKPYKHFKKSWVIFFGTLITAAFAMLSCIFFRALSMDDALHIFKSIFTMKGGHFFKGTPPVNFYYCLLALGILIGVEFFQEFIPKVKIIGHNSIIVRYAGYLVVLVLILMIGVFNGGQFIYFQF
jgi:D-alanyl-lipoteichoic acid acyltransferase DltB (MBOAT superfamily)